MKSNAADLGKWIPSPRGGNTLPWGRGGECVGAGWGMENWSSLRRLHLLCEWELVSPLSKNCEAKRKLWSRSRAGGAAGVRNHRLEVCAHQSGLP